MHIRIIDNNKCSRCRYAMRIENVGWRCSLATYYRCSNREVVNG